METIEQVHGYYEKIEHIKGDLFGCLPTFDGDRAPSPDEIQMVATFYMNGEITIMEASSYLAKPGGV